jgi:hypothetical protein
VVTHTARQYLCEKMFFIGANLNATCLGVQTQCFAGFETFWHDYRLRQAKKGVQKTKIARKKENVNWT